MSRRWTMALRGSPAPLLPARGRSLGRPKRLVVATLAALAGVLAAPLPSRSQPANDALNRYAATAPLALSAAGGGLQRVALPLAVLQASRSAAWADVRIFNAAGEPVPLAWAGAPAADTPPPREVALPRFDWPGAVDGAASAPAPLTLRLRADGAVLDVQSGAAVAASAAASDPAAPTARAWLLDLQPLGRERPAALRLAWAAPAQGLERRAAVQASADAQSWEDVGIATLVDVPGADAASAALRQPRIALSGLTPQHRYLRLVVRGGVFNLQGVVAELAVPVAAEAGLDSARFTLQADGERAWRLDAGALLPASLLQVNLAEDNAVAPLRVLRRAEGRVGRGDAPWLPVALLTAYRFQRDGSTLQAPAQPLDGALARQWRLELDARVPPPAAPPQATLWWRAPQVVFAARGGAPFTLAVGREKAAAVALPLPTVLPGWEAGAEHRLPVATVGALAAQSAAPRGVLDSLRDAPADQRRQWLLWGLLVAAVGVLGGLAWRLGREMKGKDGEG